MSGYASNLRPIRERSDALAALGRVCHLKGGILCDFTRTIDSSILINFGVMVTKGYRSEGVRK